MVELNLIEENRLFSKSEHNFVFKEENKNILRILIFTKMISDINIRDSFENLNNINDDIADRLLETYNLINDVIPTTKSDIKLGNITTPIDLANQMLDKFDNDIWSNPNAKILDPCVGKGIFPILIIKRFMDNLDIEDPQERYKHIVENILHICDIHTYNLFLTLLVIDPFNRYNLNVYNDSFIDDKFDVYQQQKWDIWEMNMYDICILSPSFNVITESGSTRTIYHKFIEKSLKYSKDNVALIPNKWMSGGKGLKKFRSTILRSNCIKNITYLENSTDLFDSDLRGGMQYIQYNKTHNSMCKIGDNEYDLSKYDIALLDYQPSSIIDKVSNYLYGNLDVLCMGQGNSLFNIKTNDAKFTDNTSLTKCYVSQSKGFIKYIDLNDTNVKKHPVLGEYMVITPETTGKGSDGFGNTVILMPNEVFSQTYIGFVVASYNAAVNLKQYMSTKFCNYLLSLRKVSQHVNSSTCRWIPLVDLNIHWTDEMLYEKFELTEEEINLIENYGN